MSLEKIIAEAMQGNPLNVKEQFAEEMQKRLSAALEEKYKNAMKAESDDEDESDDDDGDDDDDDDDEDKMVGEMKKLHASSCGKTEMYGKMKEKYGCDKAKFEGLYASYCKG
jgi:hypothetical protein